MTSLRDLFGERLGIGRRFCLVLEADDGRLVADHPIPESDYDVAVVEELDRLDARPPEGPVEVEILGRFVDGRLAGRVVATGCEPADNVGDAADA